MTRTRRTALLATGLAGASLPGAALALAAGGSSHRAAVRVPAQALAVCALDRLRPTLAAPVPLPSGTPLGRLGTAAPRRDAPGASAFPAPRQAAPGATTGAGSGPTGVTGGTGPADLRSSFGVLRRERAAADALPPEALAALRARGLDPIDVDAARLLRTTRDGGRAWVVPVAAIPPACDPVAETAPVVRALLPQRLRPGTVRPARPTTGTRSTPAPPTSAVPRPPRPAPAPPTSATGVRPPAPQAKPAPLTSAVPTTAARTPAPPLTTRRAAPRIAAAPGAIRDRGLLRAPPGRARRSQLTVLRLLAAQSAQLDRLRPALPATVRLDPRTGRVVAAAAEPGLAVVALGDAPAGGGAAGKALVRGLAWPLVEPCLGGALSVSGIVPDGVDHVDLTRADGTAVRADVADNAYAFALVPGDATAATYVVWTGADGTPHVEPVPEAAALGRLRCAPHRAAGPTSPAGPTAATGATAATAASGPTAAAGRREPPRVSPGGAGLGLRSALEALPPVAAFPRP